MLWVHNVEVARRNTWRKSRDRGFGGFKYSGGRKSNGTEGAKRRVRKLSATPPWADHQAIKQIYEAAIERGQRTGKKYHVDHIVPLQGKNVCGLHVQSNLRIVLARTNAKKGNRFDKCTEALVLRLMRQDQQKTCKRF